MAAPENWDSDVSNKMSNLNVNAAAFVPSWLPADNSQAGKTIAKR